VCAAQRALYTSGSPGRTFWQSHVVSQTMGIFPGSILFQLGVTGTSNGAVDVPKRWPHCIAPGVWTARIWEGWRAQTCRAHCTCAVEVICAFGLLLSLLQASDQAENQSPQIHTRSSSQAEKEGTSHHFQTYGSPRTSLPWGEDYLAHHCIGGCS